MKAYKVLSGGTLKSEVVQLCPTLWDPMDCSPPGSSVHGIFQARILGGKKGKKKKEYWSGLPFPSPGDLPNPRIKPGSPALRADALPSEPPGTLLRPIILYIWNIYYCGQESLRRNGVAIIVNKRVWNAVLGCNLKNDRMISIRFQGKPFSITVVQVYALTSNAEEAEVEPFCEDIQDLLELTPKKRCPFHYRGLECKSRKSRNTWSNRQIWPWSTKRSRAKANRVLLKECTSHSKHPLPTTQEKTLHMDIARWSIPKSDWLYSLQPKTEKLYTVSKNKTGSWLCGSYREFLIAKFIFKLKKLGKSTIQVWPKSNPLWLYTGSDK